MGFRQLSGSEHSRFVKRLDAVLENHAIATAVLATNEGYQLAAPSNSHGIDTLHVADACAKIAAVGRQLGGLPATSPRGINVCDLAGSPMVVVPIGQALLVVIGRQSANMGMVAGAARDVARDLADDIHLIEADKPKEEGKSFVFDADGLTAKVLDSIEKRRYELHEGEA